MRRLVSSCNFSTTTPKPLFIDRTNNQWEYVKHLVKNQHNIDIKPIKGKGAGLVSTCKIKYGSQIFSERPLYFYNVPGTRSCSVCSKPLVQLNEIVKGTPMEGRKDVLEISQKLQNTLDFKCSSGKSCSPKSTSKSLDIRNLIDEYHESLEHTFQDHDTTISNLMIEIFWQIIQQYRTMRQSGKDSNTSLKESTLAIENLMAFPFHTAIEKESMPILDSAKFDHDWIKANFSKLDNSIPQKFFDYQTYVSYYVRVNLNYLENIAVSPLVEWLNRNEQDLSPEELSIINEWIKLDANQNLLSTRVLGIYPVSALLNHHCKPNVAAQTNTNNSFTWLACRDIEEGEELTIPYVDKTLPFEERQKFLSERHFFSCPCSSDCTI